MKRIRITLLAAFAALTVASCGKNDTAPEGGNPVNPDDAGRVAVQFTGATLDVRPAAASTRAESPWTRSGRIGIYALGETTTDIMDGYANVGYTYNASQRAFFANDEAIYFPVDGSKRRFVAYYPYGELTANIYKVDLTTQPSLNDQAAFELLWTDATTAYDKTQPAVALNFDHQYARVTIRVKPGTGIERAELAKIDVAMTGMHLKADFDVVTGTMTPTDEAGALAFWRNRDGSGQYALVMPTDADAARTVDFTLGEDTFRWAIGEKAFAAGKIYDYTVTVSRTPLGLTATVTDWEEGDSDSGVAE